MEHERIKNRDHFIGDRKKSGIFYSIVTAMFFLIVDIKAEGYAGGSIIAVSGDDQEARKFGCVIRMKAASKAKQRKPEAFIFLP